MGSSRGEGCGVQGVTALGFFFYCMRKVSQLSRRHSSSMLSCCLRSKVNRLYERFRLPYCPTPNDTCLISDIVDVQRSTAPLINSLTDAILLWIYSTRRASARQIPSDRIRSYSCGQEKNHVLIRSSSLGKLP